MRDMRNSTLVVRVGVRASVRDAEEQSLMCG